MINKLKMIAIEHSWLGLIKNYVQLKKGIKRMISN